MWQSSPSYSIPPLMLQQPQPAQYTPQPNSASTDSPVSAGSNGPDSTIDCSFKRQENGPILWFAGPPLNVTEQEGPVHSLAYLEWKRKQSSNK